jgi:Flp pilus assembly protein TadD
MIRAVSHFAHFPNGPDQSVSKAGPGPMPSRTRLPSRTALRVLRLGAIACLGCALALPAAAQWPSTIPSAGMGTGVGRRGRSGVSGTVRDADGQRPIAAVEVQLWSLAGGMAASTFTGPSGTFTFSEVPRGNYYLIVKANGYEQLRENIDGGVRPSIGLQLTLRRMKPFGPPPVSNAPTVSVRELSIPSKAREAMHRGLTLLNEKSDYKGSISQFERAIREYTGYYEAYMQIGLAYMRMGDTAKSEQALLTSVTMSEHQYPEALLNLASMYSAEKRYADAEPLAHEAVDLDPLSVAARQELARALHGLGQGQAAEAAALEAKRLQPDDPQTYLILANIHLKANRYRALIRDLDQYLELEPDGPQAEQARNMRKVVLEHVPNAAPPEQPAQ